MEAIARELQPSPTRTFFGAIRLRSLGTAVSALVVAWHLGTVRAWPIAPRVRARSFALVIAVAFVLGSATLVAAAAMAVVVPPSMEQPRVVDRAPAAFPATPTASSAPAATPPPADDPSPVPAVVDPTDRPSGGKVIVPATRPTAGPEQADDEQDGAKAGLDGDGSDDASHHDSDGAETPEPAHEDDHESDDGHASETPEPDDSESGDDGFDGGADGGEPTDGGDGSGG